MPAAWARQAPVRSQPGGAEEPGDAGARTRHARVVAQREAITANVWWLSLPILSNISHLSTFSMLFIRHQSMQDGSPQSCDLEERGVRSMTPCPK